MKPYYDEDGITVYHGDAASILDSIAPADILVTDPPYGIGLGVENNTARNGGYGGHLGKGKYKSYEDTYDNFVGLVVPIINKALDKTKCGIVFSGPHIHEQRKPTAIGGIYSPAAAGRTAWGSKNFLPILLYGTPPSAGQHRPTVIYSTAISDRTDHPCPKPAEWLVWLVSSFSEPHHTVLDPFMGSGTTLRAAKDLGRRAIGIEIEERYCEIAAKRLQQGVLFPAQ